MRSSASIVVEFAFGSGRVFLFGASAAL